METVLDVQNVTHSYHKTTGETLALSHLSFSLQKGDFLSIVGPSGCGKSTLLSIISGLIEPEDGLVTINRSKIGYMLQKDHLFEWRTVYKNILLGLELNHQITSEAKIRAYHMLSQYGLEGFANARPSELSGGMRQRAALIRTLIMDPELLLLDEPFSALDYQTRLTVGDEIGQIIRKEHKTAILVTHDIAEAISMSDRVMILTKRPGTVKSIIPFTFPKDENTPLARRNTTIFNQYFQSVWKELNDHD